MHRERTLAAQAGDRSVRSGPETAIKRDIFYLDAHCLTRYCVTRELARRLPEFNVVGHALVQELIASADCRLDNAAVAILYVRPDRFGHHPTGNAERDVAFALNTLEQTAPKLPRVLLSEVEIPEDIVKAFDQRVRGYMPTSLPIDQVAEAIRFVAAGGTFIPQSVLSLHTRPNVDSEYSSDSPDLSAMMSSFSPRQTEVLRMLWKGHSNKLIAYELQMCESTVKVHIRHIMKKLKANNRTQVVLRTRPQLLNEDSNIGAMEPSNQDSAWIDTAECPIPGYTARVLLGQPEGFNPVDGSRRSSEAGA
jgi:DNA-binding NarL/FixJ family response regulator